jgi:dimethylglycine dehydrogenase
VVGASVLYHLARFGWKDVALIERKDLTAGSTWHAAAAFHVVNSDINVAKLQAYTIDLYKTIEQEGDQSVGMHLTGGVNFASTPERWESLKADWASHRLMGLDTELVGPSEIGELFPLVDNSEILGGIYDRNEGHLDPHGVTHAFAKAARGYGSEVYRRNCVKELHQQADGSWQVVSEKGVIHAEHVINAAGLWAREVGAMAGLALPLIPMQHQYIVTGDIPEVMERDEELPGCLDLDGEMYLRQEGNGVLLGIYEHNSKPWALDGTPWSYGETDLLPPDLERIADSLMKGFGRFPSLEDAGIKRVVNGPFTFSPDGNPLVGPVPGARNYWAACGVMAGFCQGGGIGLTLAQWMIEGEPQADVLSMDVARYGDFANKNYTTAKVMEFYQRRFALTTPIPGAAWVLLGNTLLACTAIFGLRGLYFALFEEARVPAAVTGTAVGLVSVIGFTPDIFVSYVGGLLLDRSPGLAGHQHFFFFLAAFAAIGVIASFALMRMLHPGESRTITRPA